MEAVTPLTTFLHTLGAVLPTVHTTGFELTIANVLQWLAALAGVSGLIYGIKEKRQATRQGSQTIEKNTFDHLMEENQKLLEDIRKYRKLADKFWILRDLASHTEVGRNLIQEAETIADAIESSEDERRNAEN